MINRFKISEITPQRLWSAFWRRLEDIPHWLAWNGSSFFSVRNKQQLMSYKNIHSGKRCFIIANGPSLKAMDISALKNEITFGMNRIYLLFDQIPFVPTYYVCVNELVLEEFSKDIQGLPMPKFLNWNRRSLFNQNDPKTNFLRYQLSMHDTFGYHPEKILSSGGTVTFASLQLAYFMGFSEVILIGLDHNYVEKGTPNKVEVRQSTQDESHFHPNYFPKGVRWQLPDLLRSELAYQSARNAFEQAGRRILDATPGGKCQIFEKVEFDHLFKTANQTGTSEGEQIDG
jgi:hypothetical protein